MNRSSDTAAPTTADLTATAATDDLAVSTGLRAGPSTSDIRSIKIY